MRKMEIALRDVIHQITSDHISTTGELGFQDVFLTNRLHLDGLLVTCKTKSKNWCQESHLRIHPLVVKLVNSANQIVKSQRPFGNTMSRQSRTNKHAWVSLGVAPLERNDEFVSNQL